MRASVGWPPMAAMSLMVRLRALAPTRAGSVSMVKWMPATRQSVLKSVREEESWFRRTAQSSPGPWSVRADCGRPFVRRETSWSSPVAARESDGDIRGEDEDEEVGEIEEAVHDDGDGEVAGAVVDFCEDGAECGEGDEGEEVAVDDGEEERAGG